MADGAIDRRARTAYGAQFRVHARRDVALRAMVTHIEAGWQRHVPVTNLSLGGACLAVESPDTRAGVEVHAGDVVTLSFVAPTLWDPLVVRATVAWSSRGRAGVSFEHKSAHAVLALFELVATMAYDA